MTGRLLGIDFGVRRVGLAVSDTTGMLATPLRVLNVRGPRDAVGQLVDVCRETEAEGIVVGLPVNMDGSEGEMAELVRKFISLLTDAVDLPISTWDERLSTGQVERTLLDADMSRARRKEVRDKLAAQVILQSFLDAQNPSWVEEPLDDMP